MHWSGDAAQIKYSARIHQSYCYINHILFDRLPRIDERTATVTIAYTRPVIAIYLFLIINNSTSGSVYLAIDWNVLGACARYEVGYRRRIEPERWPQIMLSTANLMRAIYEPIVVDRLEFPKRKHAPRTSFRRQKTLWN